jgi:protein involved in polysaccharide export with SLBB domain
MGKFLRSCAAVALMVSAAAGCSTLGESLGFSTPTNPLTKDAKAIRDAAPVPAPVPRELAMELMPPHLVEPGDTLLVQPVEFDAPVRLPPDQPVQPDGTIDLGKYGRPIVAGHTLPEVEAIVRDAVKAKEPKPVAVTVRLLTRPGEVYYVLGEVNAPGAFPITGNDTVLRAITQAGGPTRRASLQNVIMSRPTVPESCRLVYPVCYKNIVQLGDTTTNYQLRPGDRIFVPSKSQCEDFLGGRFRKQCGPCMTPQVPCAGGACAAPGLTGYGTAIPHAPGAVSTRPAIPAIPAIPPAPQE